MNSAKQLSIGVDIGGTFTDVVVLDEASREIFSTKELTTYDNPSRGAVLGIKKIFNKAKLDLNTVGRLIHATTLFTNALIERRGARTAFITTQGFKDVIAIGRERKYDIYDLDIELSRPLVDEEDRFEVAERVDANGDVLVVLDLAELRSVARYAIERGCKSIAIGFLNSHLNASNELKAKELIAAEFPDVAISLSHQIANEAREYDRFSSVIANAYIQPLADSYLSNFRSAIESADVKAPIYIMRSNGGLTTIREALTAPIHLLESGPAAGTLAASYFAKTADADDFIALDLGGTTAKLCAIENGEPVLAHTFEAAREKRFVPESGIPILTPTVDLIEIGAGGGGIAHIDQLGLLKVGPQSAGSEPGPASYGRGGKRATVTDANLMMGYLNPAYFANGEIPLDTAKAQEVVEQLSGALQVSQRNAILGIYDLANESMASAARVHAAERGKDPSRLALLVTGGGWSHSWHRRSAKAWHQETDLSSKRRGGLCDWSCSCPRSPRFGSVLRHHIE